MILMSHEDGSGPILDLRGWTSIHQLYGLHQGITDSCTNGFASLINTDSSNVANQAIDIEAGVWTTSIRIVDYSKLATSINHYQGMHDNSEHCLSEDRKSIVERINGNRRKHPMFPHFHSCSFMFIHFHLFSICFQFYSSFTFHSFSFISIRFDVDVSSIFKGYL